MKPILLKHFPAHFLKQLTSSIITIEHCFIKPIIPDSQRNRHGLKQCISTNVFELHQGCNSCSYQENKPTKPVCVRTGGLPFSKTGRIFHSVWSQTPCIVLQTGPAWLPPAPTLRIRSRSHSPIHRVPPILNASVIHYLETGSSQRCFSMPLAYTIPLFTVLDGNLATGIWALTVVKGDHVWEDEIATLC